MLCLIGKTTFIRYLIERDFLGIRIGKFSLLFFFNVLRVEFVWPFFLFVGFPVHFFFVLLSII